MLFIRLNSVKWDKVTMTSEEGAAKYYFYEVHHNSIKKQARVQQQQ